MKGRDFKRWRKALDMSQKEAAEALGLKRRVVQYYEKGERNGDPVKIPRTVRLACYAINVGTSDYHGPDKKQEKSQETEAAVALKAGETRRGKKGRKRTRK